MSSLVTDFLREYSKDLKEGKSPNLDSFPIQFSWYIDKIVESDNIIEYHTVAKMFNTTHNIIFKFEKKIVSEVSDDYLVKVIKRVLKNYVKKLFQSYAEYVHTWEVGRIELG